MDFESYFADVLSQLTCNASDEYKSTCITYEYTVAEIRNNEDYFKKCLKNGLSAYKALLFFDDYLNGEYNI